MRIAEIHLTPVAIPDRPLLNCKGVHQPHALRTVIEVICDDGTVGLGESYGSIKALDGLRRAAPALIGLDPFHLHELKSRVITALPGSGGINAKSAVADHKLTDVVASAFEVPCLDIQGKLLGRPVSDLLGGAIHTSVPFSAYLFFKFAAHIGEAPDEWGEVLTPDQMVGEARRMVDTYGFQSLKLKGGVLHPDLEIETMLKLREAFPNHPLRIDPNGGWTVDTAIYIARKLENILEYLEDPVIGMDQMAQVAAATSIPLATNMIVLEFDRSPRPFAKCGADCAVRSPLLGWTARLDPSRKDLRDVGSWRLHAFQLASRHHSGGNGPCCRRNAEPELRLRHALPMDRCRRDRGHAVHVPWRSPRCSQWAGTWRDARSAKLTELAALYEQTSMKERDDTAYMKLFDPAYERRVPRW